MNTETLQLIVAVAAAGSALGAVIAAFIALAQLRNMAHQVTLQRQELQLQADAMGESREREKKWETVRACQRYTNDENITRATKEIWDASNGGTDYTSMTTPPHPLFLFLNYIESLAIGIDQGIYDEAIVRDNHEDTFYKVWRVFFLGEPGSFRGTTWNACHKLVSREEYPFFCGRCEAWFDAGFDAGYRDPGS